MVGTAAPFVRVGLAGGQGLALAIPDVTPPTVVSFSPADNATSVSVSTDMVATMSEVVVLGASGLISLKLTSDNSTIQTWNVATQAGTGAGQVSVVGGNALTMRLTGPLAATTEFYLIWGAGVVKDTSGNNIAAQASTTLWSFTTAAAADVTPPTVVSFSPLDNATGVGVAADLVATMSETVVLGTGVITLKRTSDNATIDSWNVATAGGSTAGKVEVVGGTALTMHLTTALANSIEHYVIWDANVVKDLANNPIAVQASTTLWSFTTVAGGFTGLIDVLGVSATRAYSTRKLRSAYAGSAIRIRRSSDNAELDIGFVGENLDTAAVSTFVGANSAYVVKMYDQSGNADDMVQATVANQPRIVNAGVLDVKNGKATPWFETALAVLHYYTNSVNSSVQTFGLICAVDSAVEPGPSLGGYRAAISGTTAGIVALGTSGAATWYTAGGIASYSTDNGANAVLFGNVLQNVRGTDATGVNPGCPLQIARNTTQGTSQSWPGWIGEVVTFATQLSAPNYATLYTNQKTYWGTP